MQFRPNRKLILTILICQRLFKTKQISPWLWCQRRKERVGIEFTFLGSLLTVPTFNFNVLVNKMRNSFTQEKKKQKTKGEISTLNDTWVWCYAAQFSEPLHRSARWLEMSLSVCFSSRKAVYSAECEESLSPLRPLLLTPPKPLQQRAGTGANAFVN